MAYSHSTTPAHYYTNMEANKAAYNNKNNSNRKTKHINSVRCVQIIECKHYETVIKCQQIYAKQLEFIFW